MVQGFRSNYAKHFFNACVNPLLCTWIGTDSPTEYAYFFFYSFVRNTYIKRLTAKLPPGSRLPPLSTAAELLLGALAGALAQIFTIPVSVIATRQQVGRSPNDNTPPKNLLQEAQDDSFLGVAREIVREEGVTGLWLGIKPGLVLTVNPAITYGMFERVKSILLLAKAKAGSGDKLTPGLTFLVGALSKTLATVVSFSSINRQFFCLFKPALFRLHIPTYSPKSESRPAVQTPKILMDPYLHRSGIITPKRSMPVH